MSSNILKKPVLMPFTSGNQPQSSGQASNPNSSENLPNSSVSVQNPQNVYFIYGNATVPLSSSPAPAVTSSVAIASDQERERRMSVLENRVIAAVDKLEKLLKTQEEKKKFQHISFGATANNLNRPFASEWVQTQNHPITFGEPYTTNAPTFGTRSFERPFWFGTENSSNAFNRARGLFEQQAMNQTKSEGAMRNPKLIRFAQAKENNLDIIDGIAKPGSYALHDISDDEN